MADNKGAPQNNSKPAAPQSFSPEAEANSRINILQSQVALLQKDVRTLQGRLTNRDPVAIKKLHEENKQLRARLGKLEKAFLTLIMETNRPKQAEDEKQQFEVLRTALVDYCKRANIDPEIWKNIVS